MIELQVYRLALTVAILTVVAVMLSACASLPTLDKPDANATPAQRVAILQDQVMAANGNASAETMAAYGRALLDVGDFATAATVLDQAVDPANPNGRVLNWRGAARAEIGDIAGARADFADAVRLGNQAAAGNLDKLVQATTAMAQEPPKLKSTAGRSVPKRISHRTSEAPKASKIEPKAVSAPIAPTTPAPTFESRWRLL